MIDFTNKIRLRGELASLPQFSFENRAGKFYQFTLSVPRLSGTVDNIPVVVQETILNKLDPDNGEMIAINGMVRSNVVCQNDGTRRLYVFVLATDIKSESGEPINEATLSGVIYRDPVYRLTPLGREICDVMLGVKRTERRSDYLPCIFWGSTARQISSCHAKDGIRVSGRIQSREYTKITEEGPQVRTVYEISAMTADILSIVEEGGEQG